MIESGLVTLFVADMSRSLKFFIETLGLKLVRLDAGERAHIDVGYGLHLALCAARASVVKPILAPLDGHAPKSMSVGLSVRGDFDVTIGVYENRGISFCVDRAEDQLTAHFADPDGNAFYLFKSVPSEPVTVC